MAEIKTVRARVAAAFVPCVTFVACLALVACSQHAEFATGSVEQAIQGGYVDEETSGVVGLGLFEENHFFIGHCSGTLIAPNLVLTARHCVTDIPLERDGTQVECGVTDFRQTRPADSLFVSPKTERPDSPNDPSYVVGRSLHPVPGADDVCGYDVALIILERPLTADEAQPIVPRVDAEPTSLESFSSGGFGLTSDDEDATSGLRMRIDDNEVLCAPSECYLEYPELVTETEWVSADAGVCSGDSGGPALDEQGRVMGVASRGGDECRATIYGDVAYWGDFIIQTALEAAEVGGYPAPFWTSGSSNAPEGEEATEVVTPASDAVVLDEPGDEPGNAGDIECAAEDCPNADSARERGPSEKAFAAESGCAVAGVGYPNVGVHGLVWGLLALAFARGRRRRG